MKSSIFALLILSGLNAHAAPIFCGTLSQDPDGFALVSKEGLTAHIGQHTFLNSNANDRDLLLASAKSGAPVCISASMKSMSARNVLVQRIEQAGSLPVR